MKGNVYQQIIKDPKKVGLVSLGVLLSVFFLIFILRNKKTDTAPITEGQIQIVKGDEIITINENGLVTYKSKDRQYSETWDASQISLFFSLMERKARNYLSNQASGGDCGYIVFMFYNGKLVTICVDSGDEEMEEYIEPVIDRGSDISLSDLFGDDGEDVTDEDEDVFDGVINFPTTTPIPSQPSPTPTPYSVYNINTNFAPVKADCETWSGDIVNSRAIISNTFCTVNTTPTPTP